MTPDVSDEFMATIHPDRFGHAKAAAIGCWNRAMAGRTGEDVASIWRQRMREQLACYDTGILEAAGVDLEFLLDAIEQRAARERGACALRRSQEEARRIAYLAFADAVLVGAGQRRHAVRDALDRISAVCRSVPDPKTVRSWFDAVDAMGCFAIKKTGIGTNRAEPCNPPK